MGVTRLRLSKPVIAAVSGYAVAGGLELALWCDLRVADETAVFGVFCRRWGVPLIDGGTVRLPRLIGTSRAMDMILTGRAVDAAEAAAIGLANRVVPAGRALAAAQDLAAQLASFPQACLRSDRASVLDADGLGETAALAAEFAHGQVPLAQEAGAGAARFAAGAGRTGTALPFLRFLTAPGRSVAVGAGLSCVIDVHSLPQVEGGPGHAGRPDPGRRVGLHLDGDRARGAHHDRHSGPGARPRPRPPR